MITMLPTMSLVKGIESESERFKSKEENSVSIRIVRGSKHEVG